jgi:hypothetical protein
MFFSVLKLGTVELSSFDDILRLVGLIRPILKRIVSELLGFTLQLEMIAVGVKKECLLQSYAGRVACIVVELVDIVLLLLRPESRSHVGCLARGLLSSVLLFLISAILSSAIMIRSSLSNWAPNWGGGCWKDPIGVGHIYGQTGTHV